MSELEVPVRYYRHHTDPGVPCVEANLQYGHRTLRVPTDQAALVLVDVWDVHPVASHLARTDEITRTHIVPVVRAARQAGVTIVHAPSPLVAKKCAQWTRYAQAARREPATTNWPPPEFVDRAGEFAQYARPAEPMMDLWQDQLAARRIQADVEPEPDDLVVATGDQLQRLLEDRRLLHLFYAGFATNICVPFRDYGMPAFRRRGDNPILLRDCTTAIEAHDTVDDLLITKLAIRDFEMMDVAWTATTRLSDPSIGRRRGMYGRRLVMRKPLTVEAEDFTIDEGNVPAEALLVRNHFTAISPGTELASFTGLAMQSDVSDYGKYPFRPGYASVGEVIAIGPGLPRFPIGQQILHSSPHASLAIVRAGALAVPIPAGVSLDDAVFGRLAAISITARRLSGAEPGETVAVIGQGMIGNLAAQLFRLSGTRVVVVDPNVRRLQISAACGLGEQLPAIDQVLAATGGAGAETVVDATGLPDPIAAAIDVVARFGELILLGTPRGRPRSDISFTHFVGMAHKQSIRIVGAHASTSPQQDGTALPRVPVRHSIDANLRYILESMRAKADEPRLHIARCARTRCRPSGPRRPTMGCTSIPRPMSELPSPGADGLRQDLASES